MRLFKVGETRIFPAVAAAALMLLALPPAAQAKKLQVVTDRAEVHLNPDPSSPVIETLERGATMTLASAIKSRASWYYVYFTSAQTGKTRSGYVSDDAVRKLYPDIKIVEISAEGDNALPAALDLDAAYKPILDWGADKGSVLEAEGRPLGREKVEGVEIVSYKRQVMGRHCLLEYVFDGDRLAATRLSLLEIFLDKNRYIEDYLKLKDFAISKIGPPAADQVVWQDSTLRSQERLWGTALGNGQLEFQASWNAPGTEVRMKLAGGGSRITFGAEFSGTHAKTSSF